jgi:hypothetical protein
MKHRPIFYFSFNCLLNPFELVVDPKVLDKISTITRDTSSNCRNHIADTLIQGRTPNVWDKACVVVSIGNSPYQRKDIV